MEKWGLVQDTLLAVMEALVSYFLQVGFCSLVDVHDQVVLICIESEYIVYALDTPLS